MPLANRFHYRAILPKDTCRVASLALSIPISCILVFPTQAAQESESNLADAQNQGSGIEVAQAVTWPESLPASLEIANSDTRGVEGQASHFPLSPGSPEIAWPEPDSLPTAPILQPAILSTTYTPLANATFPATPPSGTQSSTSTAPIAPVNGQPVAWEPSTVAQTPSAGAGAWVLVWVPNGVAPAQLPSGYVPAWLPTTSPNGVVPSAPPADYPPGGLVWNPAQPTSGYGEGMPVLNSAPPMTVPSSLSVPALPQQSSQVPVPPPPNLTPDALPVYSAPQSQPPQPTFPATPAASVDTASDLEPLNRSLPGQPLSEPNLDLQGLYVLQGDDSSARARLSGSAFITPNLLAGGAIDIVTGPDLTNDDGVQITELYLATSFPGAPQVRFRLGQLDLTSYFDRNSFAKDISRDFFNSTFHTNPALIAGANVTASRPAGLVQWNITDDILLSAAAFSSSPSLENFDLDGFSGEIGFRTGNLILRGTYVSSRDTEFQGTNQRLQGYGVNAEYFFPSTNLGLFGRYGNLTNTSSDLSTSTYSVGANLLDLFMEEDRLGLAYGRNLSTAATGVETPDVLEVFYDFEVLPNLRAGFTFQQRNDFTESYAGFRLRGNLDLTPSVFGN